VIGIDRSIADIDSELDEEEPRKRRLKELEDGLKQQNSMRKTQEDALESLRKIAASLDQELATEKARLEEEQRGLLELQKAVSGQQSVSMN